MHLVDAHLCSDPGKYVSALLLSLSTMLHLELPHVNVLSKIDLIENYGRLGMFYCIRLCQVKADHIDNCNCCLFLLILQLLTLTSIRMCKTYHIYNIILTKILALPSTGLMLIATFLSKFWIFSLYN